MKFSTTLDERFDLEFTVNKVTENYKVRPLGGGEMMDVIELQSELKSINKDEFEKQVPIIKRLYEIVLSKIDDVQSSYEYNIKDIFPELSIQEQIRFFTFIIEQSESNGQEQNNPDTEKLNEAAKAIEAQLKAKSTK